MRFLKKIFAKTILVAITIFINLIGSSCSLVSNDFENIKSAISFPVCINAEIERDTIINFKLYIYENETLFTFTEPKTLRLLNVKKNDLGYSAQYDGIETEIRQNSILAIDALDIAHNTITTSTDCEQKTENGQNVLLFSIDGNNVLVYYNKKTNTIEKIISEAARQVFEYKILSVEKIGT